MWASLTPGRKKRLAIGREVLAQLHNFLFALLEGFRHGRGLPRQTHHLPRMLHILANRGA